MRDKLGAYRFIRHLGMGSTGETSVVQEWPSQMRIALKLISPEIVADERSLSALRAEVDAARMLEAPGLLRVLGMPQIEGQWAILRDFAEGVPLALFVRGLEARRMRLNGSAIRYLCHSVLQCVLSIHATGPHGRIHGNNILLGQDGSVRVTDPFVGNDWLRRRLVRRSLRPDELEWLWPEGLMRGEISIRSDVFLLGKIIASLARISAPESADSLGRLGDQCGARDPAARPLEVAEVDAMLQTILAEPPEAGASAGQDALANAVADFLASPEPGGPSRMSSRSERSDNTVAVPPGGGWDHTLAFSPIVHEKKRRVALMGGGFAAFFLLGFLLALVFGRVSKTGSAPSNGLDVKSFPTGAEVAALLQDDPSRQVFLGTTPCRLANLEPGSEVVLKITKQGYLPYERTLKVEEESGRMPLSVDLEVLLRIKVAPSVATVSIQGGPIEQWSLVSGERTLTSGRYQLKMEAQGFQSLSEEIDLSESTVQQRPGGVLDVNRCLLKPVALILWPSDCSVEISNPGKAEPGRLLLPVGSSSILAKSVGFTPLLCAVTVDEAGSVGYDHGQVSVDSEGRLELRLEREVQIVTSPAEADALIQGQGASFLAKGKTPMTVRGLLAGQTYVVTATAWGFVDVRRVIAPEKISGNTLEIAMERRKRPRVSIDAQDSATSLSLQNARVEAERDKVASRWNTPVQDDVEPGAYRVKVTAEGHDPLEREIVIQWEPADQSHRFQLAPWPMAVLRASRPDGIELSDAKIELDPAAEVGKRPEKSGDRIALKPGRYSLKATCPGYDSGQASFEMNDKDRQREVVVALKPTALCLIALGPCEKGVKVWLEDEKGTKRDLPLGGGAIADLLPGRYRVGVLREQTKVPQMVSVSLGDVQRRLQVSVAADEVGLEWLP